ncbi:hypothetical protein ruthe_02879 [Rubellimicrobium thermophilum DSM 16684]|uniref:Uncharacterized protein n=1 Tax=Rubellimicrobium thermophilum DSM 16684 TaxID=1123069 RepID=S9SAH1_9RHOB|nr:hypothetical protein ruthe_02879 [Rubellimicrobium thermophilum DSM 16684]
MHPLHAIVDCERYPLDRPGSADWDALVARTRAALAAEGMADLPGFLRPQARARMVAALAPASRQRALSMPAGTTSTSARRSRACPRTTLPWPRSRRAAAPWPATVWRGIC